eukprot:6627758-Karenia_brevis.AAC.1
MAMSKLITSSDKSPFGISSSNGATRCQCPPFSQAEMAALKLMALAKGPCCTSYQAMAPHAAIAHPSHKLRWLRRS